ncbi:MAG: HD domain-containing protein [Polyangiaceae bacterium]
MSAAVDVEDPELLAFPHTLLAREVIELLTEHANVAISNHSIRSYLFARLAAQVRGLEAVSDYDPELLFCACVLHDIGLTDAASGSQRFEVDGADVAAQFLTRRGVPAAQVDLVWQAIAMNTSPGIAERRSVVGALTMAGVAMDFGADTAFVSDVQAARIHEAYPRLSIGKALSEAIATQASSKPQNAPLFSASAQLLRERSVPPHVSEIERIAREGRWGE